MFSIIVFVTYAEFFMQLTFINDLIPIKVFDVKERFAVIDLVYKVVFIADFRRFGGRCGSFSLVLQYFNPSDCFSSF